MDIENILNQLSEGWDDSESKEEFKETMRALVNGNRDRWSLYRSLHFVGDDPAKSAIEDDLKIILDDETYALVEAVFQWNTDYDLT